MLPQINVIYNNRILIFRHISLLNLTMFWNYFFNCMYFFQVVIDQKSLAEFREQPHLSARELEILKTMWNRSLIPKQPNSAVIFMKQIKTYSFLSSLLSVPILPSTIWFCTVTKVANRLEIWGRVKN